ncbi:MAG: glycosyltransferase family 39 protein [Spirochaetia bacterium]|jgi:hypothetical protein
MQNDRRLFGLSGFGLLVCAFAAAKFLVHILTGQNYGYFCDELYTIALSKHLALGYVDVPPLVPFLHALSRVLFGESLLAIHIFPSLAGAATLVFVCLITRELGGRLFATGVAALGFIIAPVWLILDSFFCYDSIDQLVLAIFLYLLVRLIRTENKRLWMALGVTAGIAFLTKATILFLGPGLLIALLATKQRRHFLTPWPWFAVGIFLVIISPYVIWQYVNHWPTITYWGRYSGQKLYHSSIPEYLVNIVLTMNAVLVPLIGIGLYRIFRRFGGTRYTLFGIMFLVTFVLLFVLHARAMMLAEVCIPLIAAGAVWVEEVLTGPAWKKGVRIAAVSCMVAGGILVAPVTLTLLPLPLMQSYTQTFSFLFKPVKDFNDPKSEYPQEFSNRIGWDDLVRTVSDVYHTLPPEDQAKAGIFCDWYGPAGAIDLLGPRYGLPHAVTGHMNYYRWGPGESIWEVMIFVTANIDPFRPFFGEVQQKARITNDFAMLYNRNTVYVARNPFWSSKVIWAELKGW